MHHKQYGYFSLFILKVYFQINKGLYNKGIFPRQMAYQNYIPADNLKMISKICIA